MRPIGMNKCPKADGSFCVLIPICLILGRSHHKLPDNTNFASYLTDSDRYQLIQHVTSKFWSQWCKEVTPQSVIRKKWHKSQENLHLRDIVLVNDQYPIIGKYVLVIVEEFSLRKTWLCQVLHGKVQSRRSQGCG